MRAKRRIYDRKILVTGLLDARRPTEAGQALFWGG
jgi:hypothetical protein